jgi:methionyl aminopeptidase
MQKPYTQEEIEILKVGGKNLREILHLVKAEFKDGKTTWEMDEIAEKLILEKGDIPVFKNYRPNGAKYPFPCTICISINDEVAHGIPHKEKKIKNGDLISIDLGLRHKGLVVDSAISFIVGEELGFGSVPEKKLLEITKTAMEIGIENCVAGNYVNDIGKGVEKYVQEQSKYLQKISGKKCEVVDILCGHAVGRVVHAEPLIPHVDMGKKGEMLTEGMVIAIEPHIALGNGDIFLSRDDDWTYKTKDKSKTAQFEHTVYISKEGPVILT